MCPLPLRKQRSASGTIESKLPELLEMRGPEIYLYYPNGVGRSKLSGSAIENKLDTLRPLRATGTRSPKLIEVGRTLEGARAGSLSALARAPQMPVEQLAGQRLAVRRERAIAACVYGASCRTP